MKKILLSIFALCVFGFALADTVSEPKIFNITDNIQAYEDAANQIKSLPKTFVINLFNTGKSIETTRHFIYVNGYYDDNEITFFMQPKKNLITNVVIEKIDEIN